jgi:hypothetical protein
MAVPDFVEKCFWLHWYLFSLLCETLVETPKLGVSTGYHIGHLIFERASVKASTEAVIISVLAEKP